MQACHEKKPSVWKGKWVVHSQSAGRGQNSLRYLARYVFRAAISNDRIKSIENNIIRFSYKDRQRKTWKTCKATGMLYTTGLSKCRFSEVLIMVSNGHELLNFRLTISSQIFFESFP
ncbi:MAG: transposase [Deltaproteobacteria bacterium]|nr:transposase [Deltaproteobacteria bacterium]